MSNVTLGVVGVVVLITFWFSVKFVWWLSGRVLSRVDEITQSPVEIGFKKLLTVVIFAPIVTGTVLFGIALMLPKSMLNLISPH